MTATLKMAHQAIGVEVRRGTYDIVVDGQRAGSLEMSDTIELPVEPGRAWRSSSAVKPVIGLRDDRVAGRDQPGNSRRTYATNPAVTSRMR
jgi:hypothetical protein